MAGTPTPLDEAQIAPLVCWNCQRMMACMIHRQTINPFDITPTTPYTAQTTVVTPTGNPAPGGPWGDETVYNANLHVCRYCGFKVYELPTEYTAYIVSWRDAAAVQGVKNVAVDYWQPPEGHEIELDTPGEEEPEEE
jgi:hypothetical protein